jgi:hypothetical protein
MYWLALQRTGMSATWRAELYDVVCSRFDICEVLLLPFQNTAAKILAEY